MMRTPPIALAAIIIAFLTNIGLLWMQTREANADTTGSLETAGFLLLLPIGLLLLISSALPYSDEARVPKRLSISEDDLKQPAVYHLGSMTENQAAAAATAALVVWAAATLAYFGAGFAFQFGGLAIGNPHPDFAALYWNWSPLDESYGTRWGVVGLRGWALLGAAGTSGVYDLFLRHTALLGVVVVIPSFILYHYLRTIGLVFFGLLAGTLIYPIVGNWVWSSGWLANLGLTLGLGHGFVDAGIATPFALAGIISLAALRVFRNSPTNDEPFSLEAPANGPDENESGLTVEVPMPTAYLPLLSFVGLGLILWSWPFIASSAHLPTAVPIAAPRTALNGILATLAGGLMATLYSRFVTGQFNALMACRAATAGLVVMSTVAPFIVPWQAMAVGAVVGFVTPLFVYLVDYLLQLADHTASVATFALMGLVAWLLPGLIADGSIGIGWNQVGLTHYLSVEGQGVSGLWVAPGYVSDWPHQFNAQLLGAAAILSWTFLLAFVLFKFYVWLAVLRQIALTKANQT